mmetsp:Transcript_7780/g.19871  ORF Transcript_7780/g.19871 Transcript_7780/m.19871 type:complete len:212 (-) Transcript_7780:536-1171(-)
MSAPYTRMSCWALTWSALLRTTRTLSSCPRSIWMIRLNSSEMSSLCASKRRRMRSARSMNHSVTCAAKGGGTRELTRRARQRRDGSGRHGQRGTRGGALGDAQHGSTCACWPRPRPPHTHAELRPDHPKRPPRTAVRVQSDAPICTPTPTASTQGGAVQPRTQPALPRCARCAGCAHFVHVIPAHVALLLAREHAGRVDKGEALQDRRGQL